MIRLLGRGSMGSVYEAQHLLIGKRRALKVLNWEFGEDVGMRDRFLREARMAADLTHPNIIHVSDVEDDDGRLYIVMDLVAGADLRQLLQQHKLDPERALGIIEQAAAGLDFAHGEGFVHRDVKPANILVGSGDVVVLTDFGIAKSSRSTRQLTVAGDFLGTLSYAAPEQFDERGAEPASDRYALGCVLWECLTGTVPFDGESYWQIMHAHMNATVPPVGDGLPRALDRVFARALAKEPEERFETAQEMVAATREALATPDPVYAKGGTVHDAGRAVRPAPAPARDGTAPAKPPATPPRPARTDDSAPSDPKIGEEPERGTRLEPRPGPRPSHDAAPQGSAPGRAQRLGRSLRTPIGVAAIALPLAAVAGLVAGHAAAGTTHVPHVRTVSVPSAQTVTQHGVRLRVPAGWRARTAPAAFGGISGVSIGPARDRSSFLIVGLARPRHPSPLVLPHTAEAVSLGQVQALRSSTIWVKSGSPAVRYAIDVWRAASARGDVVIACVHVTPATGEANPKPPLPDSLRAACETSASTLQVAGEAPLSVMPKAGDVTAIRVALASASTARRAARARLAAASRSAQAHAAGTIAKAYARSATKVAARPPALAVRSARAAVVRLLRSDAAAFAALAKAAKRGSEGSWTAASRDVSATDKHLRAAATTLDRALAGHALL